MLNWFIVLFRSTIFFYFSVYSFYWLLRVDTEIPIKNLNLPTQKKIIVYIVELYVTLFCKNKIKRSVQTLQKRKKEEYFKGESK